MDAQLVIVQGYDSRGEVSGFHLRLETRTVSEAFLECTGVDVVAHYALVYEFERGLKNINRVIDGSEIGVSIARYFGLVKAHERILEKAQTYSRDLRLSLEDHSYFREDPSCLEEELCFMYHI